ncbi:MAG TPA: DNA repair protein RecO [Gaiellaceae bacterium]|nr:DNA repair protein RecO [Gaiellaceae bacterium]
MASRTLRTEAVVLRSIRFSEADCVLHLYTLERGRVGAIAKGVRKTRSRFGARLEPLSHVELLLHEGRGELMTVRGAELLRSHDRSRAEAYRLAVGHIGLEAMLRLFVEQDSQPPAFHALTRFLDVLDGVDAELPARPALDPLALSFQLKLLWLAGYLPHLAGCAACGEARPLVGFSARAGGAVCRECAASAVPVSEAGFVGIRTLLEHPLAAAHGAGLSPDALRQCLRVIESSYEEHGGFRLRTLAQSG